MAQTLKQRQSGERKAGGSGTLFGRPIVEPLAQLNARYPFPARLNSHHLERLRGAKSGRLYRKGAILFKEGDRPVGVYVVLEGRVKLSLNSAQGKVLVLGFFGPGTVLGLAAAILGRAHPATAEALKPTNAVFVARAELAREMRGDATGARQVAELLGEACYFLLTRLAAVELSESARQKLARCLLGLMAHNANHERVPVQLELNQETVAQMVGLSRETVSRLLSQFRRKGVLDWTRSDFVIRDRRALEKLAGLPEAIASGAEVGARKEAATPESVYSAAR
jgi:CRP/FNR family transcriptional regulator, cyclic AMP receptor protein